MIEKLSLSKRVETADSMEVAAEQADFSRRWAKLYRNGEYSGDAAAMLLQNPVDYVESGCINQLPSGLRQRWDNWLGGLAYGVAVTGDHSNAASVSKDHTKSLFEIQNIVTNQDLDDELRGDIWYFLRKTSKLFEQSVAIVPGDTEKYALQLAKMREWEHQEQAEYLPSID